MVDEVDEGGGRMPMNTTIERKVNQMNGIFARVQQVVPQSSTG